MKEEFSGRNDEIREPIDSLEAKKIHTKSPEDAYLSF